MLTMQPPQQQQRPASWQQVLAPETTKHLASIYRRTGPMSGIVSQMAQNADLVALCKQPQIPYITQKLLHRFVSHSMRMAPEQKEQQVVHVNPKIFLSGYMMLFFPYQSMDPTTESSVLVRTKAESVIQRFEQIIYALETRPSLGHLPITLTQGFHLLLNDFNQAFATWRMHDSERLITQLRFERIALQNAQNITPADKTDLRHEIQRKIETARQKVLILGGQAALDRMDREMATTSTEAFDPSLSTVHLDRPSNESIAHAMLLNPKFRFNNEHDIFSANRRLQLEVQAGYYRAYWARVAYELDRGEYEAARAAVQKIAITLGDMDSPLPFDACATLRAGSFDRQSAEDLVAHIKEHMGALLLTERVPEMEAKWEVCVAAASASLNQWFCAALHFFIDCIEIISTDLSNARLDLIAPAIQASGVEYERQHFAAKLRSGEITLQRTAAWIKQSMAHVHAATPEALRNEQPHIAIQMEGLQRIVLETPNITPQTIPEILRLDAIYLAHLREELRSIAIGSAAHIHATKILQRGPALAKLREWFATHSFNLKDAMAQLDTLDVAEHRDSLEAAFRQVVNPTDALLNVVVRRIKDIWRRLLKGLALEGNDVIYVNVHMNRLNATVELLTKIASVNRQVHLESYTALIQTATGTLDRESRRFICHA